MITRASHLVVVEGPFVGPGGDASPPTVPRRVEIDIRTGLITAVSEPRGTGDIVLGDDHVIFSGLVDRHVHAREDPSGEDTYKESFQTAADAALHGGIVAYAEMPNNPQPPVDDYWTGHDGLKVHLVRRAYADLMQIMESQTEVQTRIGTEWKKKGDLVVWAIVGKLKCFSVTRR